MAAALEMSVGVGCDRALVEADRDPEDLDQTLEQYATELRAHPGTLAHHRVDDVIRAWDVFDAAGRDVYAVMMAGQEDSAFATSLIDWRGTGRAAFVSAADKAVQALVAALGSLIDVSRRVMSKEPADLRVEYDRRVAAAVMQEPGAGLLKGLRNYLLHYGHAPWRVDGRFGPNEAAVTITLVGEDLLMWDGWKVATRALIQREGNVNLGPLVSDYRNTLRDLYAWLVSVMQNVHAEEIAAANGVVRRRNLFLSDGAFETREAFMEVVTRGITEWRAARPKDP